MSFLIIFGLDFLCEFIHRANRASVLYFFFVVGATKVNGKLKST